LHTAHGALARFLESQGKLSEALAESRLEARGLPNDGGAQYRLGNLLHRSGLLTEAEHVLLEAQRLRPNDGPTKTALAQVRQKLKLAGDEQAARAAASEQPTDAAARAGLGNLLAGLGQLEGAEAELTEAVRLVPETVSFRQSLASVLSRQKKLAEEETQRREIIRLKPLDAGAHFSLGNACARQGQWPAALAAFEKSAELDSKNHWAWYGVTVLRLELGDVEGYRQASREMLDRFQNDPLPEVWDRAAKTCLLTADGAGELERAVALADKAVAGNEKNRYFWYFQFSKGLAEYRAGNDAAALVWLDKFLARRQTITATQTTYAPFYASGQAVLALAQHRLKRSADAAAALTSAQALVKQWMPAGTTEQPFNFDWDDWLRARLLVREAETTLKAAAVETGQGK